MPFLGLRGSGTARAFGLFGVGRPSAPTINAVNRSSGTATISFTESLSSGGSPISNYFVRDTGGSGLSASGTTSPLSVSGLTNSTTYSFKLVANNIVGSSEDSNTGSLNVPAPGQAAYTSGGSYTFTAPTGVNEVHVLAVGGGGGGAAKGGGGGGGGLAYRNSLPVTPGSNYTVNVGYPSSFTAPGGNVTANAGSSGTGGDVASKPGGPGGTGSAPSGTAQTGGTGGAGINSSSYSAGGGGGGAAGYSGSGGNGGPTNQGAAEQPAGGGGGVGIFGEGPSGSGGPEVVNGGLAGGGGSGGGGGGGSGGGGWGATGIGGGGGSSGNSGSSASGLGGSGGPGGTYGGGGGGSAYTYNGGGGAGGGAVRILWGLNRSWPSQSTGDL